MAINLKRGKSIDPFELETAEGLLSPPEVKLWSHLKHTYIHPVIHSYKIYPYKNVTKNLKLGFFTEYLEKNLGAELPFTFYLLVLYVLFLNLWNRVLAGSSRCVLSAAISNASAETGRGKSSVFPVCFPILGAQFNWEVYVTRCTVEFLH